MPRAQAERREPAGVLVRHRLPDAQREALALGDAPEDPGRAEPAVLVVDRDDAALVAMRMPVARRLDPLVLRDGDVPLAELPGGLLAQDPGRLAVLVALDDAAVDLEVAARERERRAS